MEYRRAEIQILIWREEIDSVASGRVNQLGVESRTENVGWFD